MPQIRQPPALTTALLTILALCAAGWGLYSAPAKGTVAARPASAAAENSAPTSPLSQAWQGSEASLRSPERLNSRVAHGGAPEAVSTAPSAAPERLLSLRDLDGHPLPDVPLRLRLAEQVGKSWLVVTGPDGRARVPHELPEEVDDVLLFEHEPEPDPLTEVAALPMQLLPAACTARELGSESPFVLTAERALGILAIKVLQPNGKPLPEAGLWLSLGDTSEGGGGWFTELRTDERGEVSHPLYESDARLGGTLSLKRRDDGLMANPLPLGVPIVPQEVVVRCFPACALLVEVVGPQGEPVTGAEVSLRGRRFVMDRAIDTEGLVRFENLAAGDYTLQVNHPGGWGNLATSWVHLEPSESRALKLTLPTRLDSVFVVGGRLMDEEGKPVVAARLAVSVGGRLTRWVHTSEEGRFSYRIPTDAIDTQEWAFLSRAFVSVRPRAGVFASHFSPRMERVPIGTQDLEFRRLGTPPEGETLVEFVDAQTGTRVVDPEGEAMVTLYRPAPGGERIVNWASYGGRDGLVPVEYYRHPDIWLAASLPGYRLTRQPLTLNADGSAKQLVRVQLERGFGDTLLVLGPDKQPVSGAEFLDSQGNVVAVTDLDGKVTIRGEEHESLTVQAPGFAPTEWWGGHGSLQSDGTIWLSR